MAEHRVRLTDEDIALVIAALKARRAMTRSEREHHVDRLVERLLEMRSGNPKWALSEDSQTHEEDINFNR